MFIYSPADGSRLSSINLDDIASRTGLVRHHSPKFSPSCFLQSLLSAVISGQASLAQIAAGLGLRLGNSLSKQALQKRFEQAPSDFLSEVIAELALTHFRTRVSYLNKGSFGRVVVEDSSFCSMHRGIFCPRKWANRHSRVRNRSLLRSTCRYAQIKHLSRCHRTGKIHWQEPYQ